MPTLKQYYTALARELGSSQSFTATSTSADATDAARQIISTDLLTDSDVSTTYANEWVYALDGALAGQQRRVRNAGFDPDTGTLTLTRAFGSTPQSGVAWMLTSPLPVISQYGVKGLRECINEALRVMTATDFIAFTGVADQPRYTLDLTTYPWMIEKRRLIKLWRPYPNATDERKPDTRTFAYIADYETPAIQPSSGYDTGDAFEMEVRRPANSRLKISGTWANQTTYDAGLVADADEALPPLDDVVAMAFCEAYQWMSTVGSVRPSAWLEQRYAKHEARAAGLRWQNDLTEKSPPVQRFYGTGGWGGAWR